MHSLLLKISTAKKQLVVEKDRSVDKARSGRQAGTCVHWTGLVRAWYGPGTVRVFAGPGKEKGKERERERGGGWGAVAVKPSEALQYKFQLLTESD
jgi:hypothetical protein